MTTSRPVERFPMVMILTLIIITFANFFDRSLTGIMAEDIKRDLQLSDSELGLSIGVAFTLFNSVLALPIARLADKGHRLLVIMGSITTWSIMTFLAGFAQNIWHLTATRIGVAVGEAGINPSIHALISTKFNPAKTGFYISLMAFGGYLGMAAAPAVGGWAADHIGWRSTFMLFGPLSLLLLPLAYFVLRDSQPDANSAIDVAKADESAPQGAFLFLLRQQTFLLLWLGSSLIFVGANAYFVYSGSFLMRTFGISATEAGRDLAIAFGFPPLFAALVGGFMFDKLRAISWRLALAVPAVCCFLSAIVAIAGWFSDSAMNATICLAFATALFGVTTGPGFATAQLLAPPGMRSMASAILSLGLGVIGSVGPILTGYVSDVMSVSVGDQSLRYGLTAASMVAMIGAGFLLAAGFSLQRTMKNPALAPAAT